MRTIKVEDAPGALRKLEHILGFGLHGYVPGTVALRPGHHLNTDALRAYLATALNIHTSTLHIREFGHGQSNPTFYVGTDGGERLVLRKKPPGKLLKVRAVHQPPAPVHAP
jgi:acyl-CoA dehydrogenase family protein 10